MRHKLIWSLILLIGLGILFVTITSVPLRLKIENLIYQLALFILQRPAS